MTSEDKPRLLDQVRELIRVRHYSIRTEQAYVQWIRRFIVFNGMRHPNELGAEQVSAFLSHLAVQKHVAASTQNQALNSILFLYRDVMKVQLPWLNNQGSAKQDSVMQGSAKQGSAKQERRAYESDLAEPRVTQRSEVLLDASPA